MDILAQLNEVLADRYEVLREVGAGGMATVYLARDVKHGRQVALKVLKPELGAVLGVERFLAEIRVTANLQHPNLLPLFDSGEAHGLLFYVMPFVEGETLRARLDREKQLPMEEAVRITVAIAGALEYAHGHNVIHRDLKPENILLQAGQPVIADFGIALAVSNAGGARVTQTGLSLGTPQYMSPEQATGDRNVDGRTDIYSLGAMTYEMITGELPHAGSTAQAIIARLMTEEVRPLSVLRRSVPPQIDAAVRKALEKLPADRYESAKAYAAALTDSRPMTTAAVPNAPTVPSRRRSPLTMALGGALAVTMALLAWALTRSAPASRTNGVTRFSMRVGETEQRYLGNSGETVYGVPVIPALALSPNAALLAYAAWTPSGDSTVSSLFIRRFDEERATAIPGTEGAAGPFFSPDGEWVGFSANGFLKRVRVTGGAPEVIASHPVVSSASWGDDGSILYVAYLVQAPGLYRVPSTGGTPQLVLPRDTTLVNGALVHAQMLPGSRVALLGFTTIDPGRSRIAKLDLTSGALTPLLTNAQHPVYAASGHLLFMRNGTLMAVAFDPDRAVVRGEPVAALNEV
uniref:protein kinase domain-containing protein n=1 Tax=Luteitalea sp. TaxID=2004800 RepID=UPI0025B88C00